ncbi:C45 family peptidase [uncultured Ruegeria sp.]|uniref:C45 family peptidase n=1 Tax=uncultured Ruegeria sp. TaxID=259304 RepID=UPI002621CD12|nr:C45 family peptidase [uncultured Ruegeria sp.]
MTDLNCQTETIGTHERPEYALRRRFCTLKENRSGEAWSNLLHAHWPGWRDWYLARGATTAASESESTRALRRYMPEMIGLIDRLSNNLPDDPVLREFLTFWCPPRYLVSCTQAVSSDHLGPFLMRNYDLDPELNEMTLLRSNWRGKTVMGMVEGLSGLSDGMNEDGLAVSLSFGGRIVSGRGFGIPLLIRYVLETCIDVQDAVEALRTIPCHMSYNVTLTDRHGAHATVFLSPDRPAMVRPTPWATNHQLGVEWPRHGRMSATLERAQCLTRLYSDGNPHENALRTVFLNPPFYSANFRVGYGTVFTALYRPSSRSVQLVWKDGQSHRWQMNKFETTSIEIEYTDAGSAVLSHQSQELSKSRMKT